jgi:hypothetical protein
MTRLITQKQEAKAKLLDVVLENFANHFVAYNKAVKDTVASQGDTNPGGIDDLAGNLRGTLRDIKENNDWQSAITAWDGNVRIFFDKRFLRYHALLDILRANASQLVDKPKAAQATKDLDTAQKDWLLIGEAMFDLWKALSEVS